MHKMCKPQQFAVPIQLPKLKYCIIKVYIHLHKLKINIDIITAIHRHKRRHKRLETGDSFMLLIPLDSKLLYLD